MRAHTRVELDMKRSFTIGFDAKHANRGNTTRSSYARFIIGALADACPKSAYFRMYIESVELHKEFEALAMHHNVEAMEPDIELLSYLALSMT